MKKKDVKILYFYFFKNTKFGTYLVACPFLSCNSQCMNHNVIQNQNRCKNFYLKKNLKLKLD